MACCRTTNLEDLSLRYFSTYPEVLLIGENPELEMAVVQFIRMHDDYLSEFIWMESLQHH